MRAPEIDSSEIQRSLELPASSGLLLPSYPLLDHLTSLAINRGVYEPFEERVQAAFNNPDPNLTVEVVVVGLTKVAKSSLRVELRQRLAELTGVPFYTQDYENAINIGRSQGKIIHKSGFVTPKEFSYANLYDNYTTNLFLSCVPGRKGVVREFPGITQDPISKKGVTRGDWDFLRNDVYVAGGERKRREVFMIVFGASEGMRRRNMWNWLKDLEERKRQEGQPFTGYEVSLQASKQHAEALVEIMWHLISTRALGEKSHFYDIQSKSELERRIAQRGETVRTIIRSVVKPRISQAIYGDVRSSDVIYLENKDMPNRDPLKGYLQAKELIDEAYGVLPTMRQLAEGPGGFILRNELKHLLPGVVQGEE
jgi:hypothetical protein